MHNRPPPSVSIDSLENPGDKALIACWAGQHVLLSICKKGLSSTMGSSVWAFFQLQAIPQVGQFSPEKCHLLTNEQWHQVSTEAGTCIGGQSVYRVNAAPPVALQSLRHGLGAQFRQKSSGRRTLQSTGTSWAGPCAALTLPQCPQDQWTYRALWQNSISPAVKVDRFMGLDD